MQNNFYQQILSPSNLSASLKEPLVPYQAIQERHVQILWFEQKYFRRLKTTEGEEIHVLSPGLWNSGSGPDFKKAHVRIGDKEFRGDIEIHLTDAGWRSHGHDKDPRYNDVILHLSLWPSKNELRLYTATGRPLLQSYFEPFLESSLADLVSLIDIDLYPYQHLASPGKCAEAVFEKLLPAQKDDFFESAAEWRLLTKAHRLKQYAADDNEAFLYGAIQALGYKNNTQAFTELYEALKKWRHLKEMPLLSKALELCGLFEDPYKTRWQADPYYAELRALHHSATAVSRIRMDFHQIRPFNHPVRRIAYLVQLLLDSQSDSFFDRHLFYWKDILSSSNEVSLHLNVLPEYESPYWKTHYVFGSKTKSLTLRFLGDQIQKTVFINTLLPLIYKHFFKNENKNGLKQLKKIYHSLTSNDSGKKSYLEKRFFGKSTDRNKLQMAFHEQGALQLHADFCTRFETSCEGCPFIYEYHRCQKL